jgi:hypothetical protein
MRRPNPLFKSEVIMRLGADPEVFLQDQQGKLISVIGYINADKWNPLQIPDMAQGFTLQEDNVALEYGIPPAASAEEFVQHIRSVMQRSKDWLPNLSFSNLACAVFPEDQMQHPAAHMFGCEPDFNAWTKDINPKPRPPHPLMRSAGGHVHIETNMDAFDVVRRCDLYLGVAASLMDKDSLRKELYGKAGACRPKPYGVEYRTLSNFWIFEDRLIDWVWRNTERALSSTTDVWAIQDRIFDAINNNNKREARKLVKQFDLEVI